METMLGEIFLLYLSEMKGFSCNVITVGTISTAA